MESPHTPEVPFKIQMQRLGKSAPQMLVATVILFVLWEAVH